MLHLLVPTDFSPIANSAFLYALSLAKKTGAELTLLHVYMVDFSLPMPNTASYEIQVARQQAGEAGIKKMLESAAGSGVIIHTKIEQGITWDVIDEVAKKEKMDAIIIGTKGEHNAAEVFFGSVTTHVISNSACPVWVVPENYEYKAVEQIAYAMELFKDNSDTITHILWLAKMLGSSVHCVHINTDAAEDSFEKANFDELIQVHGNDVPLFFEQMESHSVNEGLSQFVKDKNIDLLVMLRPQRSLFDRIFHRSQTRKLALHTNIPLYIFKANASC